MEGNELKKWREDNSMTQAQLADSLGVKMNTVYRWETGKLPISLTTELAIEGLEARIKKQKINEAKRLIEESEK